jgi:hypothetical protein
MPAPAGFKTFQAGAVLSATSDVQVYLMDQVCTVWNDAAARTSGLGSPAEGQISYLKDTDSVEVYDGGSWTAVGGSFTWTGSTANGLATYGSSTTVVAESTATYDGTTLALTQSGGGLKMDGLSSADANTLDDYEEGTFSVAFTASTGTITAAANTCTYVKIGRLVLIGGEVGVSAISGPTGTLRITGLPFTVGVNMYTATTAKYLASAVTQGTVISDIPAGQTYMNPVSWGGGDSYEQIADKVDTGTYFMVFGSYYANA